MPRRSTAKQPSRQPPISTLGVSTLQGCAEYVRRELSELERSYHGKQKKDERGRLDQKVEVYKRVLDAIESDNAGRVHLALCALRNMVREENCRLYMGLLPLVCRLERAAKCGDPANSADVAMRAPKTPRP